MAPTAKRMLMDGGLPAVNSTGMSSVQLLERAHQAISRHLTLAGMMSIWRAVGRVIAATMIKGKGVHLEGLGTFYFDVKGVPAFRLEPVRGIKWRPAFRDLPGQCAVLPGVSAELVMNLSNSSRELVNRVVDMVIKTVQHSAKGSACSSFFVSFAGVGEFVWVARSGQGLGGDGKAGVRFQAKLKARIAHAMRTGTTKLSMRELLSECFVKPLLPAPGCTDG